MNKKVIQVQAPGRINLIGEHTDYNQGLVLPAAIDKRTVFSIEVNGTPNRCTVQATQINESLEFDLNSVRPVSAGWQNYILGVVHELQQLGARMSGFDASFEGDVPIGSGMSSSAALECSLAYGLNELFDLGLDTWDLIRACQLAEHHFVGIKCGIMDQFASMLGKPNSVMLLDCRTLEYSYVPLELGDYQLLLLNTQVSHELASSDFNLRRSSCEEGLAFFQKQLPGVTSLRDVDQTLFEKYKQDLPVPIANRVRHVLTENNRVLQATDALAKQDFKRLGELMYASHESLQHDYEVSCPELDFLVDLSRQNPAVLGSRMMGGGFGGCTLNLIHSTAVERFISENAEAYSSRFGIQLVAYPVQIGSGASECEV